MTKNKLFWRMNIIDSNFKNKQNIPCWDCKKIINGNAYLYHGMLHCENCSKEYIKETNKNWTNYKVIKNNKEKIKFLEISFDKEDLNLYNFKDLIVILLSAIKQNKETFTFENYILSNNDYHCWIWDRKNKYIKFDMDNDTFQDWKEIKQLFEIFFEILKNNFLQ